MFEHLQRYRWVLPVLRYRSVEELRRRAPQSLIQRAERMARRQAGR